MGWTISTATVDGTSADGIALRNTATKIITMGTFHVSVSGCLVDRFESGEFAWPRPCRDEFDVLDARRPRRHASPGCDAATFRQQLDVPRARIFGSHMRLCAAGWCGSSPSTELSGS